MVFIFLLIAIENDLLFRFFRGYEPAADRPEGRRITSKDIITRFAIFVNTLFIKKRPFRMQEVVQIIVSIY